MTVGERIQMYRKQFGMSQEELGQKLLVSRQTISLWEKDQTVPTIANLVRLKEIFGVSVDDILGINVTEQNSGMLPYETYRFRFVKEELSEKSNLQKAFSSHLALCSVDCAFNLLIFGRRDDWLCDRVVVCCCDFSY